MTHPYGKIPLSNKKDQTFGDTTTWRAQNCVLWGERNSKGCILYDAIYVTFWKKQMVRTEGEEKKWPRGQEPNTQGSSLLWDLQQVDGSIFRPVKWEGPRGRTGKVPSIWNLRRFILCFSSNSMNSLNLDLKPYLKKRLILPFSQICEDSVTLT